MQTTGLLDDNLCGMHSQQLISPKIGRHYYSNRRLLNLSMRNTFVVPQLMWGQIFQEQIVLQNAIPY